MEHFFAPFIWIDSLVQRGVDNAAFFLMRRGVPKSRIVYSVGALMVLSVAGLSVEYIKAGKSGLASLFIFLTLFMLLSIHHRVKMDEQDEEKGTQLTRGNLRDVNGPWKQVWICFLVIDVITAMSTGVSSLEVFDMSWEVTMVLLYYLAKTPNVPPAQKKTVLEHAHDAA